MGPDRKNLPGQKRTASVKGRLFSENHKADRNKRFYININ